jgi:hypothetical protein
MKSNLFKGINILTIVSTLVGVVGLYIAFLNRWPPFLVQQTDRFSWEANNNTDSQPKIDISFSNKGSGNKPIVINGREPLKPLVIELEKHLADEDRKSGK